MLRKAIITLIVLAFVFSMLSIIIGSSSPGIKVITTQTVKNDIPTFFSFLTLVFILIIVLLVLIDLIIFLKKK